MSWDPKVRQPEDEAHTRSGCSVLFLSRQVRMLGLERPRTVPGKGSTNADRPRSRQRMHGHQKQINPICDFNPYIRFAMARLNRVC